MSLPEGYLPREGDILVVHAIVKFDVHKDDSDGDGEVKVHLKPVGAEWSSFRIPLSDLIGLYARRWDVGDVVRSPRRVSRGQIEKRYCGIVLAIDGDHVWVKVDDGTKMTFRANDLEENPLNPTERAPPHEPAPVIEPQSPLDGMVP